MKNLLIVWKAVMVCAVFTIGCAVGSYTCSQKLWASLGWLQDLTTYEIIRDEFTQATFAVWLPMVVALFVLTIAISHGLSRSESKRKARAGEYVEAGPSAP